MHEQLEGAAAARKRAEKAGAEAADALRGARAELEALRAERATFAHDAAEVRPACGAGMQGGGGRKGRGLDISGPASDCSWFDSSQA